MERRFTFAPRGRSGRPLAGPRVQAVDYAALCPSVVSPYASSETSAVSGLLFTVAMPLYVVLTNLELLNSYLGIIVIYSATALPFCVWQMKG